MNNQILKNLLIISMLMLVIASCQKDEAINKTTSQNNFEGPFEQNISFHFDTTTFNDGWISKVKEDWVEVIKGNITVLLHYKIYNMQSQDIDQIINTAWNGIVAPRYSSLSNYRTSYISTYNRSYLGMGSVVDNASGQQKFVLLFRRGAGWIEVICPNKNTFMNQFQFDPETIQWNSNEDLVDSVADLANYNKFAIDGSDLNNVGKWSTNYSNNTFYTNYYTGAYEGMSTFTTSQWFIFGKNRAYHWEIVSTNTSGGQTSVGSANSDGIYSVPNNWQIQCSNIENNPKLYDAYYTATKGGRLLWLNDAVYPGNGTFTGFAVSN